MSLVKFKAQNHPQQVGVVGAKDNVDDRGTDPELFAELDARFHFTIDVAAAAHNAKCDRWLDPRPRMIWFARLDGKRAAVDSEGNVWVEAWRSGGCRECTRLVLEGDDRD